MARRKKLRRGNGQGSVTQRPDGQWMGQITLSWSQTGGTRPDGRGAGEQQRKTVYAATAKECWKKLEEVRRAAEEGEAEQADQTVKVFLEFWLLSQKHKVAPGSMDTYRANVAHITRHLGKRRVRELTDRHVLRFYEAMTRGGVSAAVQHLAGGTLRAALAVAVDMGLLKVNPAKRVALPRVQRAEIVPLRPEQLPPFLRACRGRRLEALPVLALDTGARLGELLALEWSDWLPSTRELRIVKALKEERDRLVVGPCKTPSSRRTVLVSPAAAGVLERHRAAMQAEAHGADPVFCTRTGRHYWSCAIRRDLWLPVRHEARLPAGMRFHDLRHSCATLLLLAGVDIKSIAARLGHSNPRQLLTTYAHVLPAMHGRMADVMDGFLAGQAPEAPPAAPTLKIAEVS